jgi:hypothetical protein
MRFTPGLRRDPNGLAAVLVPDPLFVFSPLIYTPHLKSPV